MKFWFDYKTPKIGCYYDSNTKNMTWGELSLFFEIDIFLNKKIIYKYTYTPFYSHKLNILDDVFEKRKFKDLEKNVGCKKINIGGYEFRLRHKETEYYEDTSRM